MSTNILKTDVRMHVGPQPATTPLSDQTSIVPFLLAMCTQYS